MPTSPVSGNTVRLIFHITLHVHLTDGSSKNEWELLTVCHHHGKSCEHRHCNGGIMVFLICHVASCEHVYRLCEFIGWKPLIDSHHLPIFGGHLCNASGNLNYLICRATSQNHMTEGPGNYLIRSSLCYFTPLGSLVAIDIVVVGMFLISHLIYRGHVIQESGEYMN